MKQKRLGILGGTFDPPHLGHLLLAETGRELLNLDTVLFTPAGFPPHKAENSVSPVHHRLAMTRLAIAGNPSFALDSTDIDRPPPHFTATLLPILEAAFPEHQLWLLIGSDSLRDLLSWHQPAVVLDHCRLAVLGRPGAEVDWRMLTAALPALDANVTWLDGPFVSVSASLIRLWAAAGRSLRYLVVPEVQEYIREQGLYAPSNQT